MSVRTTMEMGSNEALKQAVAAGLGLGIVSAHSVQLALRARRLCVLDVHGTPLLRHWHIVHRRGKKLSPVASAFRSFALEEAESSVDLG